MSSTSAGGASGCEAVQRGMSEPFAGYHCRMASISGALQAEFGEIDIYLFDQLLRGRFDGRRRILDAGCGGGRNLPYFLRHGFDVRAIDEDAGALDAVRRLAGTLSPALPADNFQCGSLCALPWESDSIDAVVCSAVLHFADDMQEFTTMVEEMWRVLKPGGIFFARLASSDGVEDYVEHLGGRRFRLRGGAEWLLADERMLREATGKLRGELLEPLKTVVVHGARAMAVWCLRKP